jgi:hypothetical protein
MQQKLVNSRFGNSIYWTLPIVTTVIHFTDLQHINQRLVSSVRYHFRFVTLSVSVSPSLSFLLKALSHPLTTVLYELNKGHLIKQLGCHAND